MDNYFFFSFFKLPINDRRLTCLSLILILPILLDFIVVIRGYASSITTLLIYGIIAIYGLLYATRNISAKSIIAILIYTLIVTFSIVVSKNDSYFKDQAFLLSSLFYFPLGAFVVLSISNWSNFFLIFRPYAILGTLFGVYISFFVKRDIVQKDFFSYMEFAYGILPVIIALYILYRIYNNKLDLFFFIIALASILSFGARAPILFTLCFIGWYELIYRKGHLGSLLFISVILGFSAVYIDKIAEFLLNLTMFENSRLLLFFVKGELMESGERDIIAEAAVKGLGEVGVTVSGFFGNRSYLNGAIYPHNFIYEVILDFGWIIGPFIIAWLAFIVCKDYVWNKGTLITVYAVFALFSRYVISGSYVIEGKFWIFIFILLSVYHCSMLSNRHIKHEFKI